MQINRISPTMYQHFQGRNIGNNHNNALQKTGRTVSDENIADMVIELSKELFKPYDVTITANGIIANNKAERKLVEERCKEIEEAVEIFRTIL